MNTKNTETKVRFDKPRLLIVSCGDVGMRLLPLVRERFRVFAVDALPHFHAGSPGGMDTPPMPVRPTVIR